MFETQYVDSTNAINPHCGLNTGLVGWWLNLPQTCRGYYWYDLTQNNHASPGASPSTEISGLYRRGGFAATKVNSANYYTTSSKVNKIPTAAGARTLSGWFYLTGTPNNAGIIHLSTNGGGGQEFIFYVYDVGGGVTHFFTDGVNGGNNLSTSLTLSLNQWYHVAMTMTSSYAYAIYLNSVPIISGTFGTAIGTNTQNVELGRRSGNAAFPGSLDDIRIWNRVLSPSEISGVYDDSLTGYSESINWLNAAAFLDYGQPNLIIGGGARSGGLSLVSSNNSMMASGGAIAGYTVLDGLATGTIKTSYGSKTNLTITLGSLGSTSLRQSAYVDNSSNLFSDVAVSGAIKGNSSGVSSAGYLVIYAYAGVDSGTTYSDGASGSDAAFTYNKNCRILGTVALDANSEVAYFGPYSISAAFNGVVPERWGVIVENKTGAALDAAYSHTIFYKGISLQLV